jgi:hypothetical protein
MKLLENQEMNTAKLAIVILIIAALLFVIAPNLSWGNCSRPRHGGRRNLGGRLLGILATRNTADLEGLNIP